MNAKTCQNCDVPYGPDDMFCENCGYDFITGSLPVDGGAPSAPVAPAPAAAPGAPAESSSPSPGSNPSGSPSAPTAGTGPDPDVEASAGTGSGASGPATPPSLLDPDGDNADPEAAGSGSIDVPRLRIKVAVDRSFFDEVVNDGEIDFPDPVPADQELELAGNELHVGRTSESRAIHPDIDVAALTGDQAVSSRHAVIRVANDGGFTIVDVGSTNGTFLDAVESDAIDHGVPTEIKPGTAIFVGAWTRLTILE